VVDVYDALISDRSYRSAWKPDKALSYLQAEAGRQFDPEIVRAFNRMMRGEKTPKDGERK
jgi:HD-GYP domain-containing protein (c-di-GMP phosphodiesterase class II)